MEDLGAVDPGVWIAGPVAGGDVVGEVGGAHAEAASTGITPAHRNNPRRLTTVTSLIPLAIRTRTQRSRGRLPARGVKAPGILHPGASVTRAAWSRRLGTRLGTGDRSPALPTARLRCDEGFLRILSDNT